jgi:ribosomal protein S18 acetylase RimI-like enzyme
MTDITIRKAIPQDYKRLLELFEAVDTLHRNNLPHIFQKPPGPVRDKNYFLSLLSDEEAALFIAEKEDEITGFILALSQDTPPIPVFIPTRFVMITDIAVKEEFRRKGIGRLLINETHKWAKDKAAASVELNVFAFNQEAIDFYEDIGYEIISLRMRYPVNPGQQ